MRKLLGATLILILLPFAAQEAAAPTYAANPKFSKPWYGTSSWYGAEWNGKKTACGGRFDSHRLTAAHPYLPCGTWVRITNVRTKHSCFAKITDRGPYEQGREIDVTEEVAKRIDIKRWGTEYVKIEMVIK